MVEITIASAKSSFGASRWRRRRCGVGVGVGYRRHNTSRRCSNLVDILHPKRSFHCRSRLPCDVFGEKRVSRAGRYPTIRAGIVSATGVELKVTIVAYSHPRRSFHCRSRLPCVARPRARWSCWWLSNHSCWDCISCRCSYKLLPFQPPQTIISLPLQTAVCCIGQRARCWCW